MADITSPRVLYFKGGSFLVIGLLAGAMILIEHLSWKTAGLLAVTIWAFCRAYYFAFYVIEHYVDREYRYAGLIDFVRYVARGRKRPE
jgi:hypothetical protein